MASEKQFTTFDRLLSILVLITFRNRALREKRGSTWTRNQEKERKGVQGKFWNDNYNMCTLQVIGRIYDFIVEIQMHGTCIWLFGSFVVIGMGFSCIDSGFQPCLAIS